jgi:SpoIID/LytB domain protein
MLVKIVGEKKTLTIGKELEIRRTLSPSHLYSSAFVIDRLDIAGALPGRFSLTGAGWGHGVGLCQIGAAVMGDRGYSSESILSHYFPGTAIMKLY